MAEVPVNSLEAPAGGGCSSVEVLFQRRIEFHPARKPYSPVSNGDFRLETLNPSSDVQRLPAASTGQGADAGVGKRSDGGGGFHELGLDPELSFRITFRRIGAGLANLGNTCFLNSVLQCLTYTEPFAAYLQSGKHKSSCHTAGFCAMCALENHVMNALRSTGKILSPSHLVRNLRCVSRNFRNSRQEDAHEYMVNLLELMHKCCLPYGVPSESPNAYEKSLVHKIFGGRLRSQVKCMQCSYSSNKFDPFLDLSLEIVKADSLSKALRHFTAVEQLDGGEKQYQCQRCKEKVRALKQLTIHKAPYVLTIHLKRFDSHIPGQKIDKKVFFEPNLDLKPFVSDPHGADLKYTLYGVLVHAGWSTHSGHYYCYVRTSSGIWHSLDDNQVSQVSEKTVLSQKAYMLFYVRDRSSIVKRPMDMTCKANLSAKAYGDKMVALSASVTNGVVPNGVVEIKSSTSAYGSSIFRCGATTENETVCLKANGNVSLNGLNENVLSKRVQQVAFQDAILSNESNMPLVGTVQQQIMMNFSQPAHKDNIPHGTALLNDTLSAQNGQCRNGVNYNISGVCNSELKSGTHVSEENMLSSSKPTHQKHVAGPLKGRELQKNEDVTKETVQTSSRLSMVENGNRPAESEPSGLVTQSGCVGESIQRDVNDKRCVDHQINGANWPSSLKSAGENVPEGERLKIACISEREGDESDLIQKKVPVESGTTCNVTNLKSKKCAKYPKSGLYYGRKELIAYVSVQRFVRSKKKSRNHHLSSGNAPEDHNSIDDLATSTSKDFESVNMGSKHRHRKRSCANVEVDNTCNVQSTSMDDRPERSLTKNDDTCTTQQPNLGSNPVIQIVSKEPSTNKNNSIQRDCLNLLMRGLNETTVATWDGTEVSKPPLDAPEGLRSIGYVLDEWDEEYDRGRRKKVKNSTNSFDGPNLFQETANVKAQNKLKLKGTQKRSENQPYRI